MYVWFTLARARLYVYLCCFYMQAELDSESMKITVEGGAYLEVVDRTLAPYNMGTPVGSYPLTGVFLFMLM